jgi:hypothetical protein
LEDDVNILPRLSLLAILLFGIPVAFAGSYPLGVGAFGGWDMPLVQQDIGSGPMYGVALRGHIIAFLHGQLVFRASAQGDQDKTVTPMGQSSLVATLQGGSLTGFGANLLLAGRKPAMIWPYGFIGISTNKFAPGKRDSETFFGSSWGGGLSVSLYRKLIFADINTSLLVMPIENNSASRKNWQTGIGLVYFFQIPMK